MADAGTMMAWQVFVQRADEELKASNQDALQQATAEYVDAIQKLCAAGLAEMAGIHFLQQAQDTMQERHLKQFWEQLVLGGLLRGYRDEWYSSFSSGLRELAAVLKVHCQLMELLSRQLIMNRAAASQRLPASLVGLADRYRRAVGAAFTSSAPVDLKGVLEQHFTRSLEEFGRAHRERESEDDQSLPEWAEQLMGPKYLERLQTVSKALELLALEEEGAAACMAAIGRHVREHLKGTVQADFSCSILEDALAYVNAVPLSFLRMVQLKRERAAPGASMERWGAVLGYYVYESVGAMRIEQFFDMVVDWPDSLPALRDVRECLAHTSLHSRFVASFRAATQQRLLHAGAATLDILTQYVNTIKALKEVDPRGVLLGAVGDPIKAYLRSRSDTIRCIVASLTDDNTDDSLFGELTQAATQDEGAESNGDVEDWKGLQAALQWRPDPVEVGMIDSKGRERSLDIISMLVGVYGSKELFINEYRSLLAEKLLAKTDYDCEREIRTLELLKMRFGEANLHNCEVMLKDMADSKRVNGNIKNMPMQAMSPARRPHREAPMATTSATIISALFWPALPEERFQLPAEVRERLEAYAARFFVLKTPRKLLWKPDLGAVDLCLTVGDQTLELSVTPVQATILMHFKARREWPAAQLAHAVGVPVDVLRARSMFWINQGVIAEERTAAGLVYTRCEPLAAGGGGRGGGAAVAMEEDETVPTITGAQAQLHQDMAVYEQFVMGMLTNFDSGLALERIHNMLKMFVVDPPYDKSADQLAAFLGQLVADEKLSSEGGLFKKR